MRIAMIGAGYVGLVSGACFSEFGAEVACVDADAARIDRLRAGEMPIYEPGLEELAARNAAAGRLSFTTDLAAAVGPAEAVFIAVGTPSRRGDGHADLAHVRRAAAEIAPVLDGHTVIVTKSTVPVGTGREIGRIVAGLRPDADFDMASNPEFLREGSAIGDFMRPDRVVIGADGERARGLLRRLYRPLYLLETPILLTTLETAELAKYAANAFLATKIGFVNEMADLCEALGADIQDVARAMGLDRRIGPKFLHAGPGFGGSCLPKDARALARIAADAGAAAPIVESVTAANERRKRGLADRVEAVCGGSVAGLAVAVLGLSFKPGTDDARESPSLDLVPELARRGASARVFDPKAMDQAGPRLAGARFCGDAYEALDGADALVIVTEWNEFRLLDLGRARRLMARPLIVDLRNIYREDEMRDAGFDYHSVGRPPVLAAGAP